MMHGGISRESDVITNLNINTTSARNNFKMKFETLNHNSKGGMHSGSVNTPIKPGKNVKNLTSRNFPNRKNASEMHVDVMNNK